MSYCGKCGNKIIDGDAFCRVCGAKVNAAPSYGAGAQTVRNNAAAAPQQINSVTYEGSKKFLDISYKTYQTAISFSADSVHLVQGCGLFNIKNRTVTDIAYRDIYDINVCRKPDIYSIVTTAIIIAAIIGGRIYLSPMAIILAIFMIVITVISTTAVVSIRYKNGSYLIPVERISSAEELRRKINLAMADAGIRPF